MSEICQQILIPGQRGTGLALSNVTTDILIIGCCSFCSCQCQTWTHKSFLLAVFGRQCTGMTAVQLQRNSGRDQGKETQLQSRSQGKGGQPWPRPPCIAFQRAFPKVTSCTIGVGPEPRLPKPWEGGSGLRALTLHFVLTEVPCPLQHPFPDVMLPFLFSCPKAG